LSKEFKSIEEIFTKKALDVMVRNIQDCGEKEVLFLGNIDPGGMVDIVIPYAWGNKYSVPALKKTLPDFDIVVHNHPSGNLEPSEADIAIASDLSGSYGTGFYIINNNATEVYTVVKFLKKTSISSIEPSSIIPYFEKDGYLRDLIDNFEYRIEQKQMVMDIIRAFNDSKFALIEAGTGIGKSFAYLVPSIIWAKTNKERVVISTKTINLQQQLIQSDLPKLMKDPRLKAEYALALGRGNFVCLRKLTYITQEDNIMFDADFDLKSMESLLSWAKKTKTGLKSDYMSQLDNNIWNLVSSDYEKCHKIKCPFYEACFYFEHKRRLSSCDLIIVNHYLLAYDIFLKNSLISFDENALLPPFKHIIMDEAHHIEDIMSKCFTLEASNTQIYHLLRELHNPVKNRGILLKMMVRHNHLDVLRLESEIQDRLREIRDKVMEITGYIHDTYMKIEIEYESLLKNTSCFFKDSYMRNGEIRHRIENEESDYYMIIKDSLQNIFNILSSLYLDLKTVFKGYACLPQQILDIMDMDFIILKSIYRKMTYLISVFESFFSIEDDRVYWIEFSQKYKTPVYRILNAPVLVGDFMNDALYSKLSSFVASSATLNVEDEFRFFEERTGLINLPEDQKIKSVYKSSFLTSKQALLLIPQGLSSPSEEIFYREEVITAIHRYMSYLDGGVLILFTSRLFLEEAYDRLKDVIPATGKIPMKQGDMPRDRQLMEFKSRGNGVLFALDSFWEGIDVPGKALQSVIITRLPFKSPSDPIEQARYQYIEKQGRNPFYEYALPKAILLLKQGFGRLIRNKTDRGVVFILDNRIVQKRYGRRFLKALPECPVIHGSFSAITDSLNEHFRKK